MVAYGLQMALVQAERLNLSERCRNPTAGVAPWFARKQNANVATKVVQRNPLLAKNQEYLQYEAT